MSKQSQRRAAARERQQHQQQHQAGQATRPRGFFAVVSEPGKPDRVIAEKHTTPPSPEEIARALGYRAETAPGDSSDSGELPPADVDRILHEGGEPRPATLEELLDSIDVGAGDQAGLPVEAGVEIVRSNTIDLGSVELPR